MKKRMVTVILALIMLFAIGCNNNKKVGPTNDGKEFEVQIFSGGYGAEMWKYALEEFEKDHPDVVVKPYLDNNANTAMAQRWRNGNPPDFVFLDGGGIDKDNWLKNNLLYDCSEWLETAKVNGSEEKIIDKVGASKFNYYTNSDKKKITYGLPLLESSYGTWYDSNWFTTNGLTVPKNFTELLKFGTDVKTKKTDGGQSASALCYTGVYSGYLVQGFILPALAAYNDEVFFNKIINASDPEVFVDARFESVMQRYIDFVKAENVMKGTLSLNHTLSQYRWLKHDAALIPNGLWLRSELEKDVKNDVTDGKDEAFDKLAMRYTASPLINDTQKPTLVVTTISCGIPAQCDNIDLAKEFVSYLYRDDVAKKFAQCSDSPSATNVDLTDVEVSDVLKYTNEVMASKDYLHIFKDGSWGAVDGEFNQIVNRIVDAIENKKTVMTAKEACESLKVVAKKQLG